MAGSDGPCPEVREHSKLEWEAQPGRPPQRTGGHRRIPSHSPWWPSVPGEERVSAPFCTDGKLS